MPKYRKKPVVIEAIQWMPYVTVNGDGSVSAPSNAYSQGGAAFSEFMGYDGPFDPRNGEWEIRAPYSLVIPTLEGDMLANPGDWIIRGVKGELYPCKPDIFEATYEEA